MTRPTQTPASTTDARHRLEEKRAAEGVDVIAREWCREEDEHGDRCAARAEFILWGKLFPPEALGPRCHTHAIRHTHWSLTSRVDQWAVFDLRPLRGTP